MKRVLIAAACLLGGCGMDVPDDLGVARQPILYGEIADNAEFGGIVALAIDGGEGKSYHAYCSGVLVEKNVILTAAHCLVDDADLRIGNLLRDNKIVVILDSGTDSPAPDRVFEIARAVPNPDYDDLTGMNDIGLLWLKTEVPADIADPIPMVTAFGDVKDVVDAQKTVEFVGFGVDEFGAYNQRRYLSGHLDLWCAQSWCESADGVLQPYGTVKNSLNHGGPCSGDSGGAVLVTMDDVRKVLGVISSGDESCTQYAVSTTVVAHLKWLNDAMHPKKSKSSCSADVRNDEGFCGFFAVISLFLFVIFVNRRRAVRD